MNVEGSPASRPAAAGATERGNRWSGLLVPTGEDSRSGIIPILCLALIVRLWQLGSLSLWTDEGSAWTAASLPFRELIRFCIEKDASPPLFYLLTSLSLRLGSDEFHLRLVSALASTALVWVTYRFARLLGTRRTATIAAALIALAPFQIMYAQEARAYALVALWTVLGLDLFARAALLDRPRSWVPLGIVTALGLWTQSIAVLGIGVQAAFIVLTPAGRRNMVRWVLTMAGAFVLYLPWILLTATHSDLGSSHWYVKHPGAASAAQVLRALILGSISLVHKPDSATTPGLDHYLPRTLAWLVLTAVPLVPLLGLLPRLRDPGERGMLLRYVTGALVLPLVAVFAISFWRPLWMARYFVFLSPMIAILLAVSIMSLQRRAVAMAWFALLLLVNAYAVFRYAIDYTKEPWRAVAKMVSDASDASRTAVIVTFDPDPFVFYNAKLEHPYPVYVAAHPDVPFHDTYTPGQLDQITRALRDSTARFEEVWVIVRSPNSPIRKELVRRTQLAVAEGRERIAADSLNSVQGKLRVSRYRRPLHHLIGGAPAPAETLRNAPGR